MRTSTTFLILLAAAVGIATPARADKASEEVNGVLQAVFLSMNTREMGILRPRDSDRMIRLTFGAMDVNQDQRITPDEFRSFDMGFGYLAQVRDNLGALGWRLASAYLAEGKAAAQGVDTAMVQKIF